MSKIAINDMSYHYMEYYYPVFEHVNLVLDTDWKLGLIGRNGRGKTTFLKLLHGTLAPDQGRIVKDRVTEFFPYEVKTSYVKTLDVMLENIAGLKSMEDAMEEIINANDESRFEEYQMILEAYLKADGFLMESRIRKELNLMELSEELLEREYELLSGGEKTKMLIIVLFLRNNTFVLLDEPTNHLDIDGKQRMAQYLKQKKGFIVVSHDREFLDEVIDHVLSINKADIALERGTYSSWKYNKDKRDAYELRAQTRIEKEISQLEKLAKGKREWANIAESTKNQHGKFERSSGSSAAQFMKHAKKAEAAVEENLEEKKQLLKNYEVVKDLLIQQKSFEEARLIHVKDLSFGYDNNLLIKDLSFEVNRGDRIWIRGHNGCGKSTLIKLLAGHIPSAQVHYVDDLKISETSQEPIYEEGKRFEPQAEIDGERLREICQCLGLEEEILKRPIATFSSGEKRKIDIARALATDHQLIFMDEPLNYMDVYFREQLEKAILQYQPTLVFVEHDERFGNHIANKVIALS
jgi:lincosamide and streptogramin A transport system ATP-binding/permease protein